ncbi:MAG: hypothetical protein KDK99_13595, partial [Verrucomicrobiales bacterium]|nr:hypothetical protein [Verrucomicrobiales bacterium]
MEISEKWLGEIGGWQALKAARGLLAAGAVTEIQRSDDLLRGLVGSGRSRVTAGLRIRSRTDVENLCTCPLARRTGQICDHSLAVGLASLQPTGPAAAAPSPAAARPAAARDGASTPPSPLQPATSRGRFSIFLPENLLASTGNAPPM